ncbi:MAG: carboxypeptidase regulatory-like domain-containing protein [Acidobacteriia bacterium]|nr:carboxypeptidase regulatory-like domain-containing protein [Terriglobia bacterium]
MCTRSHRLVAVLCFIPLAVTTAWAAQIGGEVKDKETGRGVSRVLVRATSVEQRPNTYETLTDREGAYIIKVPRGRYRVQAIPSGTNYLPGVYRQAENPTLPGVVELVAEDVFSFANIRLELGGSIEGRVTRVADGISLDNVRVTVEGETFRAVATTGKDGRYLVRALPPDDYSVQAGVLDSRYIPSFYPRSAFREQGERIAIHPGDKASGIDLKLDFGATIQGRIILATSNEPLPEVMAVAVPVEGNQPERFAYTDGSGNFSIHGLAQGKYIIEAGDERSESPEGTRLHRYITEFYDRKLDRELARPLEVSGADTITGINFYLVRGSHIFGRIRSVFYNRPMLDVTVRPVAQSDAKIKIPVAVSDSEGRYAVEDLPPGNYHVTVDLPPSGEQHVATWYRDQVAEKKATALTLKDDDTYPDVDFNLRLGGSVSGRVTVDDPEYSLDYKRLHLVLSTVANEIDGFEPRSYDLGQEGRYAIVGAPIGRFHLALTSEDPNVMLSPGLDVKTLVIAEGRDLRDVDFPIRVGGSISGKVILKRSRLPLDHYVILLMRFNEEFYEFHKIEHEAYTVPGLRAGKYMVVLVEQTEPMTLEKLFAGPRWYDSKIIEVKKGIETTNVDFVIDETQPVTLP